MFFGIDNKENGEYAFEGRVQSFRLNFNIGLPGAGRRYRILCSRKWLAD
jgi:hypothetical protein